MEESQGGKLQRYRHLKFRRQVVGPIVMQPFDEGDCRKNMLHSIHCASISANNNNMQYCQ